MDVSEPTPRVNFELMQRHMHKKVLLVGQIEGIENNVARLRAADGGTVQVMTKPGGQFNTQFVQFEGIVESPTQLHELDHSSFGDSLGKLKSWRIMFDENLGLRLNPFKLFQSVSPADMGVYNELCKIANQDFPQLFY